MPIVDELDDVNRQLAALAFVQDAPPGDDRNTRIRELTSRKDQLESELAKASDAFGQRQMEASLTPAQLRQMLPPKVALIDFVEYTDHAASHSDGIRASPHFIAFILRHDRALELIDIGAAEPIRQDIDLWRRSFGTGPDGKEAAQRLKRTLWSEDVQPCLDGIETVLVAPDGALSALPFAALPGNGVDSYLIEEIPIAVIPTPRLLPDLLSLAETAAPDHRTGPAEQDSTTDAAQVTSLRDQRTAPSLLAIGDVDFDASPGEAQPDSNRGGSPPARLNASLSCSDDRGLPRGAGPSGS